VPPDGVRQAACTGGRRDLSIAKVAPVRTLDAIPTIKPIPWQTRLAPLRGGRGSRGSSAGAASATSAGQSRIRTGELHYLTIGGINGDRRFSRLEPQLRSPYGVD
jgi:hypothetical protein